MEPLPKTIPIKDRDDPFIIEEVIGEGGMGKVYRARDPVTGDRLAVKVLGEVGDPTRFALESDILSKLEHPNIVGYRGHGLTKDGHPYLAMEWIDGDDLDKHLATSNLTVDETLRIARAISDALGAAHAAGVIHRDLKPSNVLLTRETRAVKLVDFGIARAASVDGLTRTGQALGTPGYMSPEQARGQPVDARSDLFSLGCLIFRCLGGRRPFAGSDIMEFATNLALEEPPPLRQLAPPSPVELETLVAQLLQKDPSLRPESALHVRQALDRIAARADRTELAPTAPGPAAPIPPTKPAGVGIEPTAIVAAPRPDPRESAPTVTAAEAPAKAGKSVTSTVPADPRSRSAPSPDARTGADVADTRRSAEAKRSPLALGGAVVVLLALLGGAALLSRKDATPAAVDAAIVARSPDVAVAPAPLDRAALDRACKRWAAAIAKGQHADGSFSGEERAAPSGWDTGQQLFALAEAYRACGDVPVASLASGARALTALRVDGGWVGPRRDAPASDDRIPETAAIAWAALAFEATTRVTKDVATAEAATRARAELLRARNADGGFRVHSLPDDSALYSTALAAWALGSAPEAKDALAWIARTVAKGSPTTRELGFTEELAWIGRRGDEAMRATLVKELVAHCRPDANGTCSRASYESGHIPYLPDGGGRLVTPWHPWTTLAAAAFAKDAALDADTKRALDGIARWGVHELTASIDVLGAAPAYKLAEYLIAVAELLDAP